MTPATARSLREIRPADIDPVAPVFGLTGEALANRVRAAARAAGLGDGFSGHSGRIAWPGGWSRQGRPTRRCSARAGGSTETWWPGTPGASQQEKH